jgi:ABC-2 type transport system ATP-binding protein
MDATIVLHTSHLKKHFGSVRAVEDVSLDIQRGEIFGFLGPNGAGKTTTISMLLGLTYATSGEIAILGEPVTPQQNGVLKLHMLDRTQAAVFAWQQGLVHRDNP